VPTRLWPMMTTKLLPLSAKLAAAWELFSSPPASDEGDESVASFVKRHFGEAMVENIADPLLAGVYGGDSAALSVRSVLPRFWEMERQHGSLTRATIEAMRKRRAASTMNDVPGVDSAGTGNAPPRKLPLFMTLKGGLQQMTEKLVAQVERYRIFCVAACLLWSLPLADREALRTPAPGGSRLLARVTRLSARTRWLSPCRRTLPAVWFLPSTTAWGNCSMASPTVLR